MNDHWVPSHSLAIRFQSSFVLLLPKKLLEVVWQEGVGYLKGLDTHNLLQSVMQLLIHVDAFVHYSIGYLLLQLLIHVDAFVHYSISYLLLQSFELFGREM